jgi:hypothetical protein
MRKAGHGKRPVKPKAGVNLAHDMIIQRQINQKIEFLSDSERAPT